MSEQILTSSSPGISRSRRFWQVVVWIGLIAPWLVVGMMAPDLWHAVQQTGQRRRNLNQATAIPAPSFGIGRVPVPAAQLNRTDILPHAEGPITPGRNYVYCSAFREAWGELRDSASEQGGPIELSGNPPLAQSLNRYRPPRSDLPESACFTRAGPINETEVHELEDTLRTRFPDISPWLTTSPRASGSGLCAYSVLLPGFRWCVSLDSMDERVPFRAQSDWRCVETFGIPNVEESRVRELQRQVRVLDFVTNDDFIIRLATRDQTEVILAKVLPAATLQKTVEPVLERIAVRSGKVERPYLEFGETLIIPEIDLAVEQRYRDLIGRVQESPGSGRGLPMIEARQIICFHLHDGGAFAVSEPIVAMQPMPWEKRGPEARLLIFDKPFLVLLRQGADAEPYLLMWIANDQLLVPFGSR